MSLLRSRSLGNVMISVLRRLDPRWFSFAKLNISTITNAFNMPKALVLLAEGAEEMETVITVDVLRRGGVEVTLAGLTGDSPVMCSRNVSIKPDASLTEALKSGPYDAVICPGGGQGAKHLAESKAVGELLVAQEARGGVIAAVCAGPTVLLSHGIATGKTVTSYPSFKDKLTGTYKYSEERVVQDGKLITSRGPGTCFEFGIKLVEVLQGKEKAEPLAGQMLVKM